MSRRLVTALAAVALLCVAIPTAATAKPKRHPVSVDVEFSFTGLIEFKQDTTGSSLTCPDSPDPYQYEDHVRAHIAFDTVWKVRIRLNPRRAQRVFESEAQKLGGSTWSISGKALSGEEGVPPQDYSCSGTFKAAAKAPIVFSPIKGGEWLALMQGAYGAVADPDGCYYQGNHRRLAHDLPDDLIERAVGGFKFKTKRLLTLRNKTVTGDFNYSQVPSDCGSDDTHTCTQSAEG